ncbi:MAG: hypothetical protein ACYDG6_11290 [Thermincolia bacterium]
MAHWSDRNPAGYKKGAKTSASVKAHWSDRNPNKKRDVIAEKVNTNQPAPQPQKKEPNKPSVLNKIGSAVNTGLKKFVAFSDSFINPFQDALTLGGTKLVRTKKTEEISKKASNEISPTTRKITSTVGNVAGTLGGLGTAGKIAKAGVAKLLPKVGKVGQGIATQAGTGALFEAGRGISEGQNLPEIGKSAAKGAALFGVMGPLGAKVGAGAKKLVPKIAAKVAPLAEKETVNAIGHYAGNAVKGVTTGVGFSYGGNLLEGQPLDNTEAGKNALIFGALEILTGGKYKNISKDYEMLAEVNKAYARGKKTGVKTTAPTVKPSTPGASPIETKLVLSKNEQSFLNMIQKTSLTLHSVKLL